MTYQHAEAFCLMLYRSDDGTEEEIIWNSRDGVTPFVITLRSGTPATHVEWSSDRRVPDHVPALGSRMFVDLTEARAGERARVVAARAFAEPGTLGQQVRAQFGTPEAMADQLAGNALSQPGAPDLVEVPQP